MDANTSSGFAPQSAPSAPKQPEQHEHYGLLLVFVIVVVAAFGWWQWKGGSFGMGGPTVIHNAQWAQGSDLSGTILLTLAAKTGGDIAAYDLDLATGDLVRKSTEGILPLYRNLSEDGHTFAVSGALHSDAGVVSDDFNLATRVFVSDAANGLTVLPESMLTRVGDTVFPSARDISVHDNGAVLFASRGESVANNNTFTGVNVWGISLARQGEDATLLVGGMQPQWISETRFVFLREDGVYLYDLERNQMLHIITTERRLTSNVHLAVSPDTRTLAVSQPDLGRVEFFTVDDWGAQDRLPSPAVLTGTLQETAFWMMFSPDSKTIALQVVDSDSFATNPNPRLAWYSPQTLQAVAPEYSLAGFVQSSMFLTDWTQ